MVGKLKIFGLALMAAVALGALASSPASAYNFTTVAGGSPISGTDIGGHKFTFTGQTIHCGNVTYSGSTSFGTFYWLPVAASYSECKTGLGTSATVTGLGKPNEPKGCWFVLNSLGTGSLECIESEVTITAQTCVIHIPAQNFGGFAFTYTNGTLSGGLGDITVDLNIEKIVANHTDGFLCPLGSSGVSESGVLEGQSTLVASEGGLVFDK